MIMRKLVVGTVLAMLVTVAQAQWHTLTPTPFGIVVTVGQWIWNNSQQIYQIDVTGQGNTVEEARLNGFRLAVEQALGSVIASQTDLRDGQIRRDEVISYAGGFVERFEITDTQRTAGQWQVTMRVWVSRNGLAERLLYKSTADGQFNGEQAATSAETRLYSQQQGDRLLSTVLQDYPTRGIDIKLRPSWVETTGYRGLVLHIRYDLTWSTTFVRALWQAQRTASRDSVSGNLYWQHMVHSHPHVLVVIKSQTGEILYQECVAHHALTHSGWGQRDRYFVSAYDGQIDRNMRENTGVELPVSARALSQISATEASVIRAKDCPKPVLWHHK